MKHPKPGRKVKHGKTAEEKSHLDKVASLGCVICGKRATIHHIRIVGEPRNHKKVIPLCYNHHQGVEGIHTLGKKAWREKHGHELEHLKRIEEML
jgi:translation initiation factor RLI1